jgi:predicted RecB family nuclease
VSVSYPIKNLDGIDAATLAAFRMAGIRTTEKLLEAARTSRGRRDLAEKTGIDEKNLLRLANMADRMRVKGLGADYAELLRVCGVDTVKELKYRNPAKLAAAMREANEKRKLVKLLPSDKTVGRWIDHARKLPLKITY